jgi:membrane associated rhomboid family serine protease
MILLPIGHEETGVRRLPWITFGIMGLCALIFVSSGRGQLFATEDVNLSRSIHDALQYYGEHPYLELDAELEQLAFREGRPDTVQEMFGTFQRDSPSPTQRDVLQREQLELNALSAQALQAYRAHSLFAFGLIPDHVAPHTLVTHMFLHAGWLHLFGNMLILYLAGPFIEDVWGRPLYLIFYLGCGLVAAFTHLAAHPDATAPMVGASGAIAGVMGAFLFRYRRTRIRFFYMVALFWRGTFSAPAIVMLPVWFGEQLFMALASGGGGGVAHWAHVGGFAAGLGGAFAIRSWGIEDQIRPGLEHKIATTVLEQRSLDEGLAALAEGDVERGIENLTAAVREDPTNHDAADALWGAASCADRSNDVAPVMLVAMRTALRIGNSDWAVERWRELMEESKDLHASPELWIRLARALGDRDAPAEARQVLRRAMLDAGSTMTTATALRIAEVALSLDPPSARASLRLALSRPDLDPDERTAAELLWARAVAIS